MPGGGIRLIELRRDTLRFRFPEVHRRATCEISFQRTLRIPDDEREHFLPPGLGRFALEHVDDYASRLPSGWKERGGVFMPMYQAEALWISFRTSDRDYPMAIKVAAGKVDAVTGEPLTNDLSSSPQNYVVLPRQPWLDGFSVGKGRIRQFVAMPLGEGYTAEEQISGAAEYGGLQLIVTPMKAEHYERLRRPEPPVQYCISMADAGVPGSAPADMGLAPGGLMRQHIYHDRHGLDTWHPDVRSRCFVHLLNSAQYRAATGYAPRSRPPTARDYTRAGLPWFDYYDADRSALKGALKLARLKSFGARRVLEGKPLADEDIPAPTPTQIRHVGPHRRVVRDGGW